MRLSLGLVSAVSNASCVRGLSAIICYPHAVPDTYERDTVCVCVCTRPHTLYRLLRTDYRLRPCTLYSHYDNAVTYVNPPRQPSVYNKLSRRLLPF